MKTEKTKKRKVWKNIRIEEVIYKHLKKVARRRKESLTQLIEALLSKE